MAMGFLSAVRSAMSGTPGPAFRKGHWIPLARTGVSASLRVVYRDWQVVIGQRSVGMTVRRTTFTVSLTSSHPPFQHSLGPFLSRQTAATASRQWIEDWHQSHAHLLSSETVHALRRKRMSKKLFKIRNTKPHS